MALGSMPTVEKQLWSDSRGLLMPYTPFVDKILCMKNGLENGVTFLFSFHMMIVWWWGSGAG